MKNESKADNASAPVFGKFQTCDELLKAYNNLESEFTKRSQRLKELQDEREDLTKRLQEASQAAARRLNDDAFLAEEVLKNEKVSKRIIESYLAEALAQNVPVLNSGTGRSALTPVSKPKNLNDAKRLADIIMRS